MLNTLQKVRMLILTSILGFAVAHCATPWGEIRKGFNVYDHPGMGVAVVSFTKTGDAAAFERLVWYYKGINGTEGNGIIYALNPNYPDDIDIHDYEKGIYIEGRLAAVALPAGEYEFYRWEGEGPGMVDKEPAPVSVHFTVKENTYNYIGNIHTDFGKKLDIDPLKMQVYNRVKRDERIFRKRYPDIKANFTVDLAKLADPVTD